MKAYGHSLPFSDLGGGCDLCAFCPLHFARLTFAGALQVAPYEEQCISTPEVPGFPLLG